MSFFRKEDLSKIGALGGGIVVVFSCAAWRVVGATGAPAAPSPAPVEVVAGAAETVGPAKPKDDAEIEPPRLFASNTTNPFRTILGAPKPPSAPAPPPAPMAGEIPALPPATPAPLEVRPMEKAPTMRVTGIVAGPNATAVLEIEGAARVVRQGQRLEDGTLVLRIGPTEVALKAHGKTRLLNVGD